MTSSVRSQNKIVMTQCFIDLIYNTTNINSLSRIRIRIRIRIHHEIQRLF